MKKSLIIYIVLVFTLLLVPSAGLLFTGGVQSIDAEKRDLADFPKLAENGTLNTAYLGEAGGWFEDHFAGRTAFVTANALIKQASLGSVYGDDVIIGTDGYLFYDGTLNDYFRRETMTPRELFITAYNVRLMQQYAQECGAQFLFILAANKNTLYPQYMPGNYLEGEGETNAQALLPYLDALGVNYTDMAQVLEGRGELYYKKDSHWTLEGSYLGYEAIMQALGRPVFSAGKPSWILTDHRGDIEEMLLPEAAGEERSPALAYAWRYSADDEPDAPNVHTENDAGTGSLMMYRDSFGEGLLPYLAETFHTGWFTQVWPCVMNDINETDADVVLLEKVERNLIDLAIRPAIMRPPEARLGACSRIISASSAEFRQEGTLVQIHGSIDPDLLKIDTPVYIAVGEGEERTAYTAFLSTNSERGGNDCYIYVGRSQLEHTPVQVQLIIERSEGPYIVYEEYLELESSGSDSENATQEDT